ncbi:MAG: hypothetical protein ACYSUX_14310 [Planctomycetota bacterium]
MPGMSGLELQKYLTDSGSDMPVIFITAHDDIPARRMAADNLSGQLALPTESVAKRHVHARGAWQRHLATTAFFLRSGQRQRRPCNRAASSGTPHRNL